jgi:RNA polymerase sigma factor (sigma-70 family)
MRTAWDTTKSVARAGPRVDHRKAQLVDLENREGQALFGFAVRLGLTQAEAQDAVQETLLRLWSQLSSGTTIDNPRKWAYRTIYRVAMDEHRLRRRSRALLDRFGRSAGRSSTLLSSDLVDIWAAVDRLSDRQRQVIYLRYQADLAFDDIGTVLGITAGAARSHCTFALAALRKAYPTGEELT